MYPPFYSARRVRESVSREPAAERSSLLSGVSGSFTGVASFFLGIRGAVRGQEGDRVEAAESKAATAAARRVGCR